MGYSVGVDIGGTFTDFVLVDDELRVQVLKTPTTPDDPARGVLTGLREVADARGTTLADLVGSIDVFVHGTTIATNAVIQRNGPKVGLLCTSGHRDILALRDGFKWERFNLHMDPPDPFIPRYLRRGVRERIDYSGAVVEPLDEGSVVAVLEDFEREGVESVAVSLLWSIVNASHERRVAELVQEHLPTADVVVSSDVLPMIREWPRTSATVLSAYIKPGISRYLTELEEELRRLGFGRRMLVMQATGGTSTIAEMQQRPIYAMGSGPAAAPAAGAAVAREFEWTSFITTDMGGTSFDVALVTDGQPHTTKEVQVDHLPIGIDALEIHSIGAGGGSIAWIDPGGALRVGPRSAGSNPGPAAYGLGGTEPTVSDADLVLGYLDENNPLGGTLRLRRDFAEQAIERHVASKLGQSVAEAAYAIYAVVNHNMVEAIKVLSVQRGIDPRDYALIVGGGAGGVHGSWLAAELEMTNVVVPKEAGAFCAMGMIAADIRHDYLRTLPQRSDSWDPSVVNELYRELEAQARAALEREGISAEGVELVRAVDAKYQNQLHELTIPVPSGRPLAESDLDEIVAAFHRAHRQLYTYAVEEAPLDFYHWRLTAFGKIAKPTSAPQELVDPDPAPASKGVRDVCFSPHGTYQTAEIFQGDRLLPGMRVRGPAVVERTTTTVVVRPGEILTVNPYGTFAISFAA
jgi:N-methylhydantoinase A